MSCKESSEKPVCCPSICEPMKSPSATSLLFASYFKPCTQHQEKPERHKDEFISPLEKLSVWTSGDAIEGNHNCETQSTRAFDRRIKVFTMVTSHPCPWGGGLFTPLLFYGVSGPWSICLIYFLCLFHFLVSLIVKCVVPGTGGVELTSQGILIIILK